MQRFKSRAFSMLVVLIATVMHQTHAQNRPPVRGAMPAIGRAYGKVLEENGRKGVEFSTVTIFAGAKDSILGGALVRANGDFSIDKLPFGQHRVKVSFIGYKTVERLITINQQNYELDLGNIRLHVDAAQLAMVEISEERASMVLSIDRRSYTVDKDLTSQGGTALEVMRNIPGLTVDAEGNVQLRNSSPTIFVDGRPTNMTLEQIPADQIERVEVITNPSAKYDASTTGGILNVVLKKNTKPGYNGSINAGAGTANRYNAGGNINVKEGRLNTSLSYNFNTRQNEVLGYTDRQNVLADQLVGGFRTDNTSTLGRQFQFVRFGFDYELSNRLTLSLSQNFSGGNFDTDDNQTFRTFDDNDQTLTSGTQINEQANFWRSSSTQLILRHNAPKKGKEWSTDFTYNRSRNGTDALYTINSFGVNGLPLFGFPSIQQNQGGGRNEVLTFQFDYVDPLTDNSKLEWGLRSNYRKNASDILVRFYNAAADDFLEDSLLTNIFDVDDIINAAYVNFSSKLRRWSYQAGLRFEQTYFTANIVNKGQTFNYFYPEGLNNLGKALFPSVYFSRPYGKQQELQLNFSRKINRPNFFQLMPFIMFADAQSFRIGNPALAPEFFNIAELNYSNTFDKGNYLGSLYFRHTEDVITNYVYLLPTDSSILVSSFINGNNQFSYGSEQTIKFELSKAFDLTVNGNFFYTDIQGGTAVGNLSNQGISWNAKFIASYRLPKQWSTQLNGNYEAPRIIPQGRTIPVHSVDFTISKNVKKVWSFNLSVIDIFNTRRFGAFYETAFFNQEFSRRRDTRFVRLTASYRFGEFDISLLKRLRRSGGSGGMMDMDF